MIIRCGGIIKMSGESKDKSRHDQQKKAIDSSNISPVFNSYAVFCRNTINPEERKTHRKVREQLDVMKKGGERYTHLFCCLILRSFIYMWRKGLGHGSGIFIVSVGA